MQIVNTTIELRDDKISVDVTINHVKYDKIDREYNIDSQVDKVYTSDEDGNIETLSIEDLTDLEIEYLDDKIDEFAIECYESGKYEFEY